MKAVKNNQRMNRFFYLAASALFLLFLISSAPHLVHHSFGQSQPTPCLAFSIAKGCHLKPTSAIEFSITEIISEWVVPSLEIWITYFTPSPFWQRAPPTV